MSDGLARTDLLDPDEAELRAAAQVNGQNFDHMPELHWRLGYACSWAVIVVVTIGLVVYYRRKRARHDA
jgi:hypothetical protein